MKNSSASPPPSRGRVLFLSPQPFFAWRGSPIRVGFDLRALTELGFRVDLLTLPVGQPCEIPGVTIHRVPNLLGVRDIPIGPSPQKLFFDVLLLFKGIGMALRTRYDVIHGVEETGAIGVVLARLRGSRLVFEKHSDPQSYRRGWWRNLVMWLYARVERWTARRADAVIATGEGLARQIQATCAGAPVHAIFDIPSSLVEARADAVARLRGELAPRGDEILIAYVGSFAVYQGVELIFQGVPAVVAQNPRARFAIIGGSPAQIATQRAALERHGVGHAVRFLGHIAPDALPDYLAAADVLLSPRLSGVNTPLKLLDYLKAGRAVLATDTPANRLILDDTNAVFVEPTPAALAAGMLRLADDAALRERLGAAARRQIESTYNFTEFRRKLGACYNGLRA